MNLDISFPLFDANLVELLNYFPQCCTCHICEVCGHVCVPAATVQWQLSMTSGSTSVLREGKWLWVFSSILKWQRISLADAPSRIYSSATLSGIRRHQYDKRTTGGHCQVCRAKRFQGKRGRARRRGVTEPTDGLTTAAVVVRAGVLCGVCVWRPRRHRAEHRGELSRRRLCWHSNQPDMFGMCACLRVFAVALASEARQPRLHPLWHSRSHRRLYEKDQVLRVVLSASGRGFGQVSWHNVRYMCII